MIAKQFISAGASVRSVLSILSLSASAIYYKPKDVVKRHNGAKPSSYTLDCEGNTISNEEVVQKIEALLSKEFVDYGYWKVACYLQDEEHLIINKKKVYRLMKEQKLLLPKTTIVAGRKTWVKELVPQVDTAFSHWEFDIKFMYVTGSGCYYPLLTVIDVKSRWLLGQLCKKSIKKDDVKALMEQVIATYQIPEQIFVRNDNGSQFESQLVQEYFFEKGIKQEFTRPATPQQNAHIESYHSILERVICKRYEFNDLLELNEKLRSWALFYNYKRIHFGCNKTSPYKNLREQGINPDDKFIRQDCKNKFIFIALNEKETSSAEEQLVRDNLADRNNTFS